MTNINLDPPAGAPTGPQPLSIVPDFKEILTQVIKKQMIALGPDITIAKVKSIPGVVVSDDGTVTEIAGEPKQITKELEEAFTELTGSLVKKTMEPLTEFLESQNMPSQTPGQTQSASAEPAMPLSEPSPISSGTDTVTPASPTPPISSMPTSPTEEAKIYSSPVMQDSAMHPTTQPTDPTPPTMPSSTPMESQTPPIPEPNQNGMPSAQTETSSSPFTTPSAAPTEPTSQTQTVDTSKPTA